MLEVPTGPTTGSGSAPTEQASNTYDTIIAHTWHSRFAQGELLQVEYRAPQMKGCLKQPMCMTLRSYPPALLTLAAVLNALTGVGGGD